MSEHLEAIDKHAPEVAQVFVDNPIRFPVPDLVRTVEDYEGLPDGTILSIVSSDEIWWPEGEVIVKRSDLDAMFVFEGRFTTFAVESLTEVSVVCRVVELGGEQ